MEKNINSPLTVQVRSALIGREPWPSGYERRLMSKRLRDGIPAQDTGHIFPYIVVKIVMFVLKGQNKR